MVLSFSWRDAVASPRRRAPVVRLVRENVLQKRVLLGPEIKMSRSPFRPSSRVWRWEMRRNARSCTRGRHAGSAASQVVAKKSGAVAPWKHTSTCNIWPTIQREIREFPSTSRKSVHLHSSCFSSLGVFVANLLCFLGSFSSWWARHENKNPED